MKYLLSILFLLFSVVVYSQSVATAFSSSPGGGALSDLHDNLVAYYTFEETAGDVIDQKNSYDLTVSGTVTREISGVVGDCYTFITDGQGKYTPDDFEFAGDYSISLWMKTNHGGTYTGLVTYNGSTGRGWSVRKDNQAASSGQARADQWWNGGNQDNYAFVQIVNDDNWYHIVHTYNASSDDLKIYINSILRGTDNNSNGVDYETDCDLEIGSHDDGQFYDGEIDEVGLWDGIVLTQAKIDELYNSGSGLAWPLDY